MGVWGLAPTAGSRGCEIPWKSRPPIGQSYWCQVQSSWHLYDIKSEGGRRRGRKKETLRDSAWSPFFGGAAPLTVPDGTVRGSPEGENPPSGKIEAHAPWQLF